MTIFDIPTTMGISKIVSRCYIIATRGGGGGGGRLVGCDCEPMQGAGMGGGGGVPNSVFNKKCCAYS